MTQQLNRFEVVAAEPFEVPFFHSPSIHVSDEFVQPWWMVQQAAMLQSVPALEPRVALTPAIESTPSASAFSASFYNSSDVERSLIRLAKLSVSNFDVDYIQGEEGLSKVSTDVGSLLGKSNRALGISVQKRNPIINDPRVRGSRIGSLAASGSHWVPARADLDTVLSKFDSRQINDVIIIPGPFSTRYGPGFQFIDFSLAGSPRYKDGYETHGRSTVDFKSNGGQVSGQQTLLAGSNDWGVRATYAQRGGSDYDSGNGNQTSAGYKSRDFNVAYGEDLGDGRSIEFSLLRLDQNEVQMPGYVFDIDSLATDGYTCDYVDEHCGFSDRFETDLWYNRTRFEGSYQNASKGLQFPILDRQVYRGSTDVDSMSTGYRQFLTWGEGNDDYRFTAGHDLRFIKQELNEISSIRDPVGNFFISNRNSPIPDSFSVNPGLFTEYQESIAETWTLKTGARVDFAQTDIVADAQTLNVVGLDFVPATYTEIVGTSTYQQEFYLWSLYGGLERKISDTLTGSLNLGYAERPPTLTELYAAQPFMLLVQNGLNNITGDPTLDSEKMLQFDVMLDYQSELYRVGIRGFHSWAFDYITFENINESPAIGAVIEQVSLQSVNTDFATLAGFETFAELFPQEILTPFATMRYVDGRDRTRNGDFDTKAGKAGMPSEKVPNRIRGDLSGIMGADAEPLPGISPLETRIGARLRNDTETERWNLEIAARIVDNQNRVATSLLENPTPGFTVWDLRGTWKPPLERDLTLVAGVENFTDKEYREHLDFRSRNGVSVFQPGINFYFGADLSY